MLWKTDDGLWWVLIGLARTRTTWEGEISNGISSPATRFARVTLDTLDINKKERSEHAYICS